MNLPDEVWNDIMRKDAKLAPFVLAMFFLICVATFVAGCQHLGFGIKGSIELVPTDTGGEKPPTFEEAEAWRKQNPHYVLGNAEVVDRAKYPAVLWLRNCTSALVGPRVVLTAAHCVKNGGRSTAEFYNGATISGTAEQSDLYKSKDHDLALILLDKAVQTIQPRSIQIQPDARKNEKLRLMGYGGTQPGGGGGNDGKLRTGTTRIRPPYRQGYDLVSKITGEDDSFLVFGDSGGPVFRMNGMLIAVNSKGNIRDTNYTTRTDHPDSEAFFRQFAKKHGVEICGVTSDCGSGAPEPEPKPEPKPCTPKQYVLKTEDDALKIQAIVCVP